jgi:type II secretory pathway pseudopilin PulG
MVEVIVAVVLIAMLSAVVVPTVLTRLAVGQADAVVVEFQNLWQGILGFRTNTGYYPSQLAYLSALPSPWTNSCAASITSNAAWRGPYETRRITGDYTVTDVTFTNAIARATVSGVVYLRITVTGVDSSVAASVERRMDGVLTGASNYTTGNTTWTKSGSQGTLVFHTPVASGDC